MQDPASAETDAVGRTTDPRLKRQSPDRGGQGRQVWHVGWPGMRADSDPQGPSVAVHLRHLHTS